MRRRGGAGGQGLAPDRDLLQAVGLACPGGVRDAGQRSVNGTGLFDDVQQVSLTADGERLFHRCERVLAEIEDLQADAAGTRTAPTGTLCVDLPMCYGRRFVLPLLATLQHEHPGLTLEVRVQDGFADLVRDGIDLAVRIGELRDSTLVARRIDSQRLAMVASPDYLRQHGTPRRLEDLSGHKAVAVRLPSSGRSRSWQLRQGRRPIEMFPVHAYPVE